MCIKLMYKQSYYITGTADNVIKAMTNTNMH